MNTSKREAPRILGVIEFDSDSEPTWRLAIRLARATDALLELVSVVDGFSEIFLRDNREISDDPDTFLAGRQLGLDVRVRRARAWGVRCIGSVLCGAPALEIPRHAARTAADLLVSPWAGGVSLQLNGEVPWDASGWPGGWEDVRRIEAL
jgi:nucleotide-binding universal stress UspA family protein